ncbi:MAG: ATP-binding protein [Candidatus Latescibacteria bacterium]|nr:ATP-binding protein [Candidatus Latescibacterota bacterium]
MSRFIERYLKKSRPEDISYSDFEQFISQGIEEHQTLEYKPRGLLVKQDGSITKSSNPRDIIGFSALAKSVASFANSEGGLLILGVKEKSEKHKGTVIKVRPGSISPLPPSVTRERIENNLAAKIQYPVEGITIVPLRKSLRSKHFVYLIDVPQSVRAPHRVNELHYYQRYNFTTYEMKHYQIADLFGRRSAPDLTIEIQKAKGMNEDRGHVTIEPLIINRGRSVAKFVTCICSIVNESWEIKQSRWHVSTSKRTCQYSTGFNSVIYPDIPTNTGYVEFRPKGTSDDQELILGFGIYAENMTEKNICLPVKLPRSAQQVTAVGR